MEISAEEMKQLIDAAVISNQEAMTATGAVIRDFSKRMVAAEIILARIDQKVTAIPQDCAIQGAAIAALQEGQRGTKELLNVKTGVFAVLATSMGILGGWISKLWLS